MHILIQKLYLFHCKWSQSLCRHRVKHPISYESLHQFWCVRWTKSRAIISGTDMHDM